MNDQATPTMNLEEADQVSKVEFDNIIANAKAIKDKIYLGLIPPPSKAQAIAMIGQMIRMAEQGREDTDRLREIDRALDDVEYAGFYEQGIYKLKAELAKFQESSFNPDWSMLQASQESLREHMLMLAAANEQIAGLECKYGLMKTAAEVNAICIDDLREQLAAAQAREQGLREAYRLARNSAAGLTNYCEDSASSRRCEKELEQAENLYRSISTPTDTTTLDAMRAEERERCMNLAKASGAYGLAEAIRAMGDK